MAMSRNLCKREGRADSMVGMVPFLTFFLVRKCLLLCVHVQQQVSDAVAVAKLVVIPAEEKRDRIKLALFYKR